MASKKILIQVILDDKASISNKKLGSSLGKTTGEFKKMTAEQEKQYITQQKNIISNKLYTDSLKQQALSQVDVADATGNARAQSGLNNAILLETGRLASDASYGFTAMANNLGQIVSLFGSFIKTNDGVVASFKQLIGSLWGTGGLLIGIQLLISFGPKIVKFFNELIGRSTLLAETFEDVTSHLGETTGKFELYIRTLQDATKGEQEQLDAIYALNEEFPEYIEKLEKAGLTIEDVKNKTKAATDINKAQREEIKKLAMSRAAQARIEEESGKLIQLSIDEEIDKRNLLSEIEKKEEEIKNKQLKIDDFNAKEKQGKLYADAKIERGILKGQIEAIEEVVKRKKESYDADVANLVEKNDKERKAIQKNIDELLKFTDIATEVTERTVVSTQEILTQGVEQNEEYLERFRQIMAGEALEEGLEQRDENLAEFGEKYRKRIEDITRYEETEAKARIAIKKNYVDAVSSISKGLKALGSLDDSFKIAAIITEKAEAISKVIIKTRETNTVISAVGKMKSALGFIGAEIQAKRRVLKNNINAGINIAGIVAAAAGGINAIKSKSSLGASLGGGAQGGEEPVEVQAPDFNVVGAGGVSQLATTLAGVTGQPLKAFVVSKEITSAQELERNITNTASVG